jgi:DNA-nicking Smr family endonuclease
LEHSHHQQYKAVLLITGRGNHSAGNPVLRGEAERILRTEGRSHVAEWAQAPRQYGGAGALVVFLKEPT